MKFSTKLTALVLVIVTITGITITVFVYIANLKMLEKAITEKLENMASDTMDKIDRTLYERYSDIQIIATDSAISSRNSSPKQITKRLAEYRNTYKTYSSLYVLDLNRIRIANTSGIGVGEQQRITEYIKDTLRGDVSAASDIYTSSSTGITNIHFAAPIKDEDGVMFGIVVAEMPITKLYEITKRATRKHKGHRNKDIEIDLIDEAGLLLYSSHNKKGILKDNLFAWEVIKRIKPKTSAVFGTLKGWDPILEEKDLFAYAYEQGYLDFKGNNWILLMYTPLKVAFAPAVELRNELVAIVSIIALIVVIITLIVSHRFTRPISMLQNATQEIGRGRLDTKIDISSNDEIGDLARSFSSMAVDLRKTLVSKDYVDNVIQAMVDALVVVNSAGKIRTINKAIIELLGYREDELIGKDISLIFAEEKEPKETKLEKLIKEGQLANYEIVLKAKDGRKIPAILNNAAMGNDEGGVSDMVYVIKDDTERRDAREKIRDLAKFPSDNPNPIMRINREGVILYSNEAGNSVLLDWGTGVGRPLPSEWKMIIDNVFAENKSRSKEIFHLDRVYNFEVVPMVGDNYANIYGSDISDRLKAEERSKLFHGLVNQSNDAIYIIDPENGKLIDVNDRVVLSTGYSKEELLALKIFDTEEKVPDISVWRDMIRELEKKSLKIFEGQLKRKDKRLTPVETSFKFIIYEKKRYILAVSRDITKRKITEELLGRQALELKDALSQALKSREVMVSMLDDNNQIREQLEQYIDELKQTQSMLVQTEKLASLGKLVSDMAHEVNNPLMVISGRAQLSMMEKIENKELEENFKIIIDQCERAKAIIQRLLSFSKPSKGEIKEVDINQALDFVIKLVEHQFSLVDIKFIRKFSDSLPAVFIDEKQMHEVFMNIVKNASEAMVEGGTITIATSSDSKTLKIDFIDTGEGISEEALKDIFDPFFTTKEEGTGLGLSVCYGIIRSHNGVLKYSSKPNEGTTATIILPIEESEENA